MNTFDPNNLIQNFESFTDLAHKKTNLLFKVLTCFMLADYSHFIGGLSGGAGKN